MRFIVSETYQEVTPESAEYGDFSDTGFVFQDETYSLRELIDYIKRNGYTRESKGTDWLTLGPWTECYRTGTERSTNLHITLK